MRNKIALLCLIIVSVNITMKAQTTDTTTYDTLIYYPLEVANCPTWLDSVWKQHVFGEYENTSQLCENTIVCGENIFHYWMDIVGACNFGYATGFSQPYHFTEPQKVCGVAAWVFGDIPNNPYNCKYFKLVDTTGVLDSVALYWSNPHWTQIDTNTHLQPIPRHYFADGLHPEVQDFSIMVDSLIYSEYNGSTGNYYYFFDHSCTYDHEKCLDADSAEVVLHPYVSIYGYHIGCDVEEAPYLKENGVWISFNADSAYSHYARKHIAWYPIILVPHFQQGINEVDISNTCGIYPNPATNSLSLISEFRVKNIEIYDMQGKKLKEVGVNEYQSQIDISSLPSGSYLMVIQTPQGNVNKKFIKQ
jgi:hypothetical protein